MKGASDIRSLEAAALGRLTIGRGQAEGYG
jgi:hypothetical protein